MKKLDYGEEKSSRSSKKLVRNSQYAKTSKFVDIYLSRMQKKASRQSNTCLRETK